MLARRSHAELREAALQRDRPSPRPTPPGGQTTRLNIALSGLLSRFAEEIASVRGLDPACGSGNFLGDSMQRLPNSELDVITFASEMRMPTFFPQVGPEQVHGISYFRRSATNGLLICLLPLLSRLGSQPQRHVGRLHRLPHHPHQLGV